MTLNADLPYLLLKSVKRSRLPSLTRLAGGGFGVLASSPRDRRKGGLGYGITRIERFRGLQFLLTAVEIAGLAVDDARFPVKFGFRRAVTTRSDCFL